jgi:hypothetical protein
MLRRLSLFVSFSILSAAAAASAQTIATPTTAGACTVNVRLATPAVATTTIELQINKKALEAVPVDVGKDTVAILLRGPLRPGDELRALRRVNGQADAAPGTAVTVAAGDGTVQCREPASDDVVVNDERGTLDASAYIGGAADNFAPAAVGGYADPEAGGRHTRVVGGFDFEFRVAGAADSRRQLWIFGETLHGVRSADIDCSAEQDKPAVCDKLTVGVTGNAGSQLKYILDNATSMEAYAGFRYEFLTLQAGEETPAKLYAAARLGVMMLNGEASSGSSTSSTATAAQVFKANHAYRTHHVGLGLLIPKGTFEASYLEVGWGVTELFDQAGVARGWRRLKIDGALSFRITDGLYGFAQIYSDFDPRGPSADSVQTFYGVSFGIGELGSLFR